MSKFFIDRPIFAWVISILIMLAGILAISSLPVEQYPRIAPPAIAITATYPGASAETLENSVTQIIEQALIGIDYLRYFSSSSDSAGNLTITLTFEPEANPDIAQVQVQNKLQSITSLLPQEVQDQGIKVNKTKSNFLLIAAFYSKDEKLDQFAIADYVNSKIADPISRVPGVGNITLFGQPYAMRIWLDADKLNSYSLSVVDIKNALAAQNIDVAAGQLGGMPAVKGQQLNATITAQTKLKTAEEFKQIILRVNQNGSQVRLKDVARIELGAQNYDIVARFMGKPASGIAITQATGANALETVKLVKERLAQLSKFMPEGIEIAYPYDTSPFVKISIKEVVKTLIEAIILVFLVMYLFLQNFRATLIPTIAVPVVLLGTFGVLSAFGFSINTLSMFAIVLAIGLLVDDAIVVVENVERIMKEEGLSPKEATRKSMQQITGALIGISLVLSAVFIPMAFFSGSTGAIYRQFSLTIVSAMAISVLVALILTPPLCATILKAHSQHNQAKGFWGWFNRKYDQGSSFYKASVKHVLSKRQRFFVIYALILLAMGIIFRDIPTAFLPDEDQGTLFVQVSTPPGATLERTLDSIKEVESYFMNQEGEIIGSIFTVTGFSFAGRGQNSALGFIRLKDWEERPREDQKVFALARRAMTALSSIKDALIFTFYPPAVTELGNASGFDLQLMDMAGLGHEALVKARDKLLTLANKNPNLIGVRHNGLSDVPSYKVIIDQEKATALGLSISDINTTLQTAWGSSYINDFLDGGRIKKVFMQGDASFRMNPKDINRWFVPNKEGNMVPFSAFTSSHWAYGSPKLERYNGVSSQNIQGAPAPGKSSGTAMQVIEEIGKELPKGIELGWTGLSYEERMAGAQTPLLYSLSLLIVFLCLAALYESWSVPFAVMLVVPLGVIGAVSATLLSGLSNDVYFQIGLLTTVGLASKNAILIVEFAKSLYEKGMDLKEAAIVSAEQRLRPILMTSIAFILGVLPMAMSNGAGSASQNAIGIGVIGGMTSATFLAIFFVPMFYVFIQTRFGKKSNAEGEEVQHV